MLRTTAKVSTSTFPVGENGDSTISLEGPGSSTPVGPLLFFNH